MKEWFCTPCIRYLVGNRYVPKIDVFDNNVCALCGMMHGKGKLMDRATLMNASKDPKAFIEKN